MVSGQEEMVFLGYDCSLHGQCGRHGMKQEETHGENPDKALRDYASGQTG